MAVYLGAWGELTGEDALALEGARFLVHVSSGYELRACLSLEFASLGARNFGAWKLASKVEKCSGSFEVAFRGRGNHQFVNYVPINMEVGVFLQKLPGGGQGIVTRAPGPRIILE